MSQSPQRPTAFYRFWGGEGERGEVDVNVNVDGGDGNTSDDGGNGEPDEATKKLQQIQEKADKAEQRAKEAEKKLADAEKVQRDKERESMEEDEKLKADHEELTEKYQKLLKIVETSHIETAIMKNKNYQWHSPSAVRALLDTEAIKLDLDTGEISGLDDQLKTIAKANQWMLVPKDEGAGAGNNAGGGYVPPDRNGTGNHPTGGSSRQRVTDDKALSKKYKFNHLVVGGTPR